MLAVCLAVTAMGGNRIKYLAQPSELRLDRVRNDIFPSTPINAYFPSFGDARNNFGSEGRAAYEETMMMMMMMT
jgi:hypothetical protein